MEKAVSNYILSNPDQRGNRLAVGYSILTREGEPKAMPYFQVLRLFFEWAMAQELNYFRNLGQRRLDPVLLLKVNRDIVNIKPAGKLALGELQI